MEALPAAWVICWPTCIDGAGHADCQHHLTRLASIASRAAHQAQLLLHASGETEALTLQHVRVSPLLVRRQA